MTLIFHISVSHARWYSIYRKESYPFRFRLTFARLDNLPDMQSTRKSSALLWTDILGNEIPSGTPLIHKKLYRLSQRFMTSFELLFVRALALNDSSMLELIWMKICQCWYRRQSLLRIWTSRCSFRVFVQCFSQIQLKLGCRFSLQIIINVLPVLTLQFNKKWHNRCSDVLIGLSILFPLIRRIQVGKNTVVVWWNHSCVHLQKYEFVHRYYSVLGGVGLYSYV